MDQRTRMEREKLLKNGAYSDVVLTVGEKVPRLSMNLHKNIICPSSGFFEKAISFQHQADQENRIALDDNNDLSDVTRMVRYLYLYEYDLDCETDRDSAHDVSWEDIYTHRRLYKMGDSFMIDELMSHSLALFIDTLDECLSRSILPRVSPVTELNGDSDLSSGSELNDGSTATSSSSEESDFTETKAIEKFNDLISEIYRSDDVLDVVFHAVLVQASIRHYSSLASSKRFKENLLGPCASLGSAILIEGEFTPKSCHLTTCTQASTKTQNLANQSDTDEVGYWGPGKASTKKKRTKKTRHAQAGWEET